MTWLKLILKAILAAVFGKWLGTDAKERRERGYEKKVETWQKKLEELERAEQKAQNAYEEYLFNGHDPAELLRLQVELDTAAEALHSHRRVQPRHTTDGAKHPFRI